MEILKAIRYYEFHVFQGVPEKPESSFGRDNFSSHTARSTGKAINHAKLNRDNNAEIIGYFVDDFDNKKEGFISKK